MIVFEVTLEVLSKANFRISHVSLKEVQVLISLKTFWSTSLYKALRALEFPRVSSSSSLDQVSSGLRVTFPAGSLIEECFH